MNKIIDHAHSETEWHSHLVTERYILCTRTPSCWAEDNELLEILERR